MLYTMSMTGHLLTLAIISAVVQCLLGALWYGVIFKKSWMKLAGFTEGQPPKNQLFAVAVSLVACFIISFVLANILGWAGTISATGGASIGMLCWFGFMAAPLITQHVFENRRANLFAINAAYWLVAMAVGGAIIAGFNR
jgi:accessory gene regulator protein AgrB